MFFQSADCTSNRFKNHVDKYNFLKQKRERRCWLQEPCHTDMQN
ncbi:hypothetical protein HanIR_Chr08g0377171 [Helianthus annuus]|nr:hypothetical protein HanIR_Chr08g0377171 [Helianthus annuus]